MFNSTSFQDNNIDFTFFQSEEDEIKLYGNSTNSSSKIVTEAVIETTPKYLCKLEQNKTILENSQRKHKQGHEFSDVSCSTSPTSSEERRLLNEGNTNSMPILLNCLAFSDDSNDREIFSIIDDKYYSDGSLSDSTITTVTSDFTSVSQFSSSLDSSYTSDENSNPSTPQKDENVIKSNSHSSAALDNRPNGVVTKHNSETPFTSKDKNVFAKKDVRDELSIIQFLKNENEEDPVIFNPNSIRNHKHYTDQDKNDVDCTENSSKSSDCSKNSRKESISNLEEDFGDISIASHSSTNSLQSSHFRGQGGKFRSKRREYNLTFSRDELIRIERENMILLKKIMAYSKPRSVTLNHPFCHKRTSAAINRARQQKKIEQDNYILYSKINALNRTKKVF